MKFTKSGAGIPAYDFVEKALGNQRNQPMEVMEPPEADFVEKPMENQRNITEWERGRRNRVSLKTQWKINEITWPNGVLGRSHFVEKPLVNQRNGRKRMRFRAIAFRWKTVSKSTKWEDWAVGLNEIKLKIRLKIRSRLRTRLRIILKLRIWCESGLESGLRLNGFRKWAVRVAFRWKTNGKSTKSQGREMDPWRRISLENQWEINEITSPEFHSRHQISLKTVSKSTKWAKLQMSEMCRISLKNR